MKQELNLKIKLDTNSKEISVEGNPNLGDLFKGLEKLLPKDSPFGHWKEFKINTNSIINWYPYYVYYPYQYNNWWTQPQSVYANGTILTNDCNYIITNNGLNATVTNTCNSNVDILELPKRRRNLLYSNVN